MPEKTLPPPVEAAYAIHVHHRPLARAETWLGGRHADLPFVPSGGLCVFDLETRPIALVKEVFEFSRFYIARSTLEDMAYAHDLPRVTDLHMPDFGHPDPVIEHLALALIARSKVLGQETDSLFADWVALAFHAHIVSAYGNVGTLKNFRYEMPPWRLRQVTEWMSDRLSDPLSIAAIAAQAGMAPDHFARAFRNATGQPPHKWLMRKRIARAKALLASSDLAISEIAVTCGFVDQSHLTRIFSRMERVTPAAWRRNCRD